MKSEKLKLANAILLLSGISAGYVQASPRAEAESVYAVQQNQACSGVVVDQNGETIIGASVMVKGTTNGTITGLEGDFSLSNVKKGDVIVISFVGYVNQEVTWKGTPLKVTLKEDSKTLEEVVVVGYATVKKANLTGAVSAVDDKILADRPIVNLGQGLQGTIPNLNITTSGKPGSGSSFNVRGETSINGGGPLILVDGVQMDPNLINPQDVASVSVLKDAASASIYGSRAAYGVILITTKSGRKDMPTQISFDASVSFNSPTTRPSYMNSMEYANWMNTAGMTTNGRPIFSQEEMDHIEAYFYDPVNNSPVFVAKDPSSDQFGNCQSGKYAYCGNTDWMKEIYKKNYPVQKYNVNIRGGGTKANYYTSVGYTDQGSMLRYGNEGFRKFNMVNNINYDINDWLHVSMKTSYIRTELDGIAQDHVHGENWIGNDTQPIMPVKHPDGNWSGQGNYTNFAAVMEEMGSRKTTKNDFWNTLALRLSPIKGLNINMDYTFNYYAEHNKNHAKSFNEYGIDGKFLQIFQYSNPNYVYEGQNNDTYNAFNLFADYEKTLGKHYFKVMVGYNQESKHTRFFSARREELISNNLPSMNAASGEKGVSNSEGSWATRSGFFRANYTFADRYLLEVNGRYDLSSKFPKDDRAVFNPSFSLGWKLSEESWFKNGTNSFFDELKLRASYGSLANQSLDNGDWYAYLSNYSSGDSGYLMGGKRPSYVLPGILVSNSVTWEKVTQWDLGLDFMILNNRLKGSFDYYQRKTEDMLGPGMILPNILGASEPRENAADMVTRGWELALSWNDQLNNGLHYSVGFNLSDSKAEITRYNNPTKSLAAAYYEGMTIGEIWGYDSSLFTSEAEIAEAADQSRLDGGIKKLPGDIHFHDINNNGVVSNGNNVVGDSDDLHVIGNNRARFRYGFNVTADWKGFDLGIFFQGVGKRDLMLPGTFTWQYGSRWRVPTAVAQDYWREDNQGGWFPRARFDGGSSMGQYQTRYLLNAAYLRLKSLTLGYTLPKALTHKIGVEKCRFYLSGENLLTFDHTPEGFDPELDDPYKYPQQKSISLGVNVVF